MYLLFHLCSIVVVFISLNNGIHQIYDEMSNFDVYQFGVMEIFRLTGSELSRNVSGGSVLKFLSI